jgi:uncharacterized membrane protein YbhN (UPF0104 family)
LPSTSALLRALAVGVASWSVAAVAFVWLVYSDVRDWPVSPLLVAGALPASYVIGFLALITPSGLGVSEGVITLILGQSLGRDKALALAISYRIIHTSVLWINIAITLSTLSFGGWMSKSVDSNHIEAQNDHIEV